MMIEIHLNETLILNLKCVHSLRKFQLLSPLKITFICPIQISMKARRALLFNKILPGSIFTGQVGAGRLKFPIKSQ
jgi:hypothetical protein